MKIGIISDIHSNLEALEKVLSFLRKKVEKIVHIGDLVGYGANPKEVLFLIVENKIEGVMGNHDSAVIDEQNALYFNEYAKKAVQWTRKVLSEEEINFLKKLSYKLNFNDFTLVHSTPSAPTQWRYLTFLEQAVEEFSYFSEKICFIGHTHTFLVVKRNNDGKIEILNETEAIIEENSKYIINVGSVGQPRDGNPASSFVIYDTEERKVKFFRLNYNKEVAAQKIIDAGLPEFLGARLLIGR